MGCMQFSHTLQLKPGTKSVAIALVNNSGEKVTIKKGDLHRVALKLPMCGPTILGTMHEYR